MKSATQGTMISITNADKIKKNISKKLNAESIKLSDASLPNFQITKSSN